MIKRNISLRSYRANLVRLGMMRVTSVGMGLTIPIVVVFWKERGLSQFEVHLLQALFSLVMVAIEVPSGYLADCWGRKRVLVVGSLLQMIGASLFIPANSFGAFLLAEAIIAVGFAMESGADEAILYGSMRKLRISHRFAAIQGKFFFFQCLGAATLCLVGGLLGYVDLRLPFVGAAICYALQCLFSLGLIEADEVSVETRRRWRGVLEGLRVSFRRGDLKRLLIGHGLLLGFSNAVLWLYQPLLQEWGVPLLWFGAVFAGMNLVAAISSRLAPEAKRMISGRSLFNLGSLLLCSSYLGLSIATGVWGVLLFFPQQLVRGVGQVLFSAAINDRVAPAARASVASVKGLLTRLLYAAALLPVGWVSDQQGLQVAVALLGVMVSALLVGPQVVLQLRKVGKVQ